MTKGKAIKAYCLECGGGTTKDVTLCVIGDCPLYPFRFGNSPDSRAYRARMAAAIKNYPAEWAEIVTDHPQVAILCGSNIARKGVLPHKALEALREARAKAQKEAAGEALR